MSKLDSFPAQIILRNGALLIISPMIISFGLWGAVPAAFSPELFGKDIPRWLVLSENISRILVFSLLGILFFEKKENEQALGWCVYGVGSQFCTIIPGVQT